MSPNPSAQTDASPAMGEASREGAANGRPPHAARARLVPPAGFPLAAHEVLDGMRGVISEPRTRRRARRALADYLAVRRVWLFSSGRASLTVALRALAGARPERRQVVMPAFTCYSVASAVVRAGLTVRLVDLAADGFEIDAESLERAVGDDTLAIVATHLLGLPTDLRPFRRAATAHDAWLVDDAAQALGARLKGQAIGGAGDLGLVSFGRGKPLSTLGGGALACDNPALIDLIEPVASAVERPGRLASTRAACEAGLYSWLLRPEVYWLPSRLPFLKIGVTEFDTEYPIHGQPGFKSGLLRATLERLDHVNEQRRQTAEHLALGLRGLPQVVLPAPPPDSYAYFLRFPLLVPGASERERLIGALRSAGYAAGRLYPRSLNRVDELAGACPDHGRSFPAAEALAERLVTLPTYPHVTADDARTMCRTVRAVLARAESE
jgi:dTDP-4-amino-4,6-dideoxygalactose transaminase